MKADDTNFEEFFRELKVVALRNSQGVITRETAREWWDDMKRNGSTGLQVGGEILLLKDFQRQG
jgi:hypothetical protein